MDNKKILNIQKFGFERQQAIHQYLFQDIYDWAGKIRTVPFSKEMGNGLVSVFSDPTAIKSDWVSLEKQTNAFVHAENLSFAQKCEALTDIFIEANHIHPFPEGNGRSLQVFMRQLAQIQGVDLDYNKTSPTEWNMASAVSSIYGELINENDQKYLIPYPPDTKPIKKIFAKIAYLSQENEQIHNELAAAKTHCHKKAEQLDSINQAKFNYYEQHMLKLLNGLADKPRTEAMRNFYENASHDMNGQAFSWVHPLQTPKQQAAEQKQRREQSNTSTDLQQQNNDYDYDR
ncbi:Fic/DOC family protein [Stenoxybacter acetivorans]|uniref:Fic/DOC family protein n=1 Tax=Stenoxybacter acetivorans TaxID=422441 RepID=UPI00068D5F7D|nr:Fic family protein [Stenoxybacter acetivorans]